MNFNKIENQQNGSSIPPGCNEECFTIDEKYGMKICREMACPKSEAVFHQRESFKMKVSKQVIDK